MNRVLIAALTVAASGCVLPKFEVSGAELSWFAGEVNDVDGEEGRRLRSCEGSLITTVEFRITDDDDEDRDKRFTWPCSAGFRTPAQFFTGASDVFVDLRPGSYRMTATSVDDPALRDGEGEPMTVSESANIVAIGAEDATLIQWELEPQPIDLVMAVEGVESCGEVAATLSYANVDGALPDLEDEAEDPLVYRQMLVSDGGLSLGGLTTACGDLTGGPDRVTGIDRGRYLLEIRVDGGEACEIELMLDGRQEPLALDLSDLPC